MIAYIDESGDEGTDGKGSRWLVLGCAMVSDSALVATRDNVRLASTLVRRDNPKNLHFKDLSHDDRRGAISVITGGPWHGTIVVSDTTNIQQGSLLHKPIYQFNYAARYVVERVSKMATVLQEPATIYFEIRRNFDLHGFRAYIQRIISMGDPRIDATWISSQRIHTMEKGVDGCLCIADGLANAGYKALEPHRTWGFRETIYLEGFKRSLWKGPPGHENVYEWGFVLMPTPLFDDFAAEYLRWTQETGQVAK